MASVKLGEKLVGLAHPVYFIADIGANHDGDLERAKALIYHCAEAGADAAKFQNFQASKIVSRHGFESLGGKLSHQANWKKSVFEVYEDASLNPDWTEILKETCEKAGVEYCTSPYDFESVERVDAHVRYYKIGSGDISWPEMLEYIASKKKPVILSTGASDLDDVTRAMSAIARHTSEIVLLQCNTNYTGARENFKHVNLRVLETYRRLWPEAVLGLSDHTTGHTTVLGAVTLGARVIEKHFTDDNSRSGPDHPFAMNPRTWREMVDATRELEDALGDGVKRVEDNEKSSYVVQRRGLRATRSLAPGEILKLGDLEPLRPIPEGGLAPHRLPELIGRLLKKPIAPGEHITWEHLS